MPRGDRTGPAGMGPMTGRGAGYCAGYEAPGFANAMPGFGFGRGGFGGGGGRGYRWRNWYYATGLPGWARYGYGPAWGSPPVGAAAPYGAAPTREQEAEMLKGQAEWLKQQLDQIGKRIEELAKEE